MRIINKRQAQLESQLFAIENRRNEIFDQLKQAKIRSAFAALDGDTSTVDVSEIVFELMELTTKSETIKFKIADEKKQSGRTKKLFAGMFKL